MMKIQNINGVLVGTLTGLGSLFMTASLSASVPTNCDNVGDVCVDGTVNAGLSSDGQLVYTTPDDAPAPLLWNNGERDWMVIGIESMNDGRGNTWALASLANLEPLSIAAAYCANLYAYGHDDWYLPASAELNVLYENREAIGKFNTEAGSRYWSSSEASNVFALAQNFSNGFINGAVKSSDLHLRCIR